MSNKLKQGKNAVEERLRKLARPVKPEEMNRMAGTEDRGRRTRSSKFFSLGRGLYQAVMYPEAVHFKNKATGELQEIDNTLIPVTDTAGDTYLTNRCNDELKVEFHNAQAAAMILMQTEDGRMLSWKLENAQDVQPRIINAVKPRHAEDDRRRAVLDNLEGEVVYENVIPGVDMNCSVQALRFKDFFTFKDLANAQPVTFLVSMPDMVPEKMEDGSIQIIAPTGEVAFTLPKPYLKDASVEAAYGAVAVSMEPAGDPFTWRITFIPDMDWMQTAQFPVVLDPAVITKNHSSAIEDNFVSSAYPNSVQSYSDTGMTVSYSSSSWGTSRAFIKFLASGLPAIDSSYYITKAIFNVKTKTAPTTAASIYLKEVPEYWNSQAITYNNAPDLSDVKPLDYQYMDSDETWYNYDISNLVRKWYGGENNGFALESTTRTYLELYTSDHAYSKPYVTINYVSLAGLEDYLVYEDQDVGRAGVGHVSLYNGNLIFERQDTSCSGNRMPVSISHIYNSCYRNVTAFGAGAGWKMNVQQTLHKETLTDDNDGSTSTYYVYMDEDGTRHHFKYANSEWKDQSGKGMTLTISGSTATITDKGHNKWVFDLPTVEFNNNYANVKMLKTLTDACGNTMTVTAIGNVLENVEDGIGRNTGFYNSSNRVNTIYSPGFGESGACGFEYDAAGRLTHVWEIAGQPGTENMYYTYDANGLLLTATNCDGVKVTYEYYTAREPFRVRRVRITGGDLCAYDRTYEYKDCLTVVTDNLSGKKLFYHFNDYGNCVSVNDQLGYACFAQYSDAYPVNHPETISKMQRSVVNLLPNHNFEASDSWSTVSYGGTGTYTYATDQKYMGTKSMKVNKTNSDGNMCVYMNFNNFEVGKTYTLSAYIRSTGSVYTYATAAFGAQWFDGAHVTPGDQWTRISTTLTASATSGTIYFITMGGPGTVWIDCAQLEEGPVANRYNMLINGDFTFNSGAHPTGWSKNSSNDSGDIVYAYSTGTKPEGLSANTMRMYGTGRSKYAGIYQDIKISGNEGDVFVAGGWSLNYSKPRKGEDYRYNIRVAFLKSGTSSTRENTPSIEWSEEWTDWQFAAGPVVAPCNYTAIRFNVDYERNINYAEFGGLFLHKEEFGQTYVYDSKGNVLSAKNAASLQDGATYDAFDNVLTYYQPGRSSSVKTTMVWGTTDAEKKKHLLRKSTSPLGTINEYTYDAYGNQLTAKTSDGTNFMQTTSVFNSKNNHVEQQIDARGMVETRNVDNTLDTLKSVTDARGQVLNYTYDQNRKVIKAATTIGGQEYANEFTYTKDKLTQVKHNTSASDADDVAYTLGYDAIGRLETVKVGTQPLVETEYNTDGTIANVTYGNNDKVAHTYDAYKRIVGTRYDGDTADRFSYIYGANGEVAQVKDNVRGTTVISEYDAANRPQRKTVLEGTAHSYTGELVYDEFDNVKTFKEQVGTGRTTYTTSFTHDNENRPTLMNFGGTRQVAYTYDGLGRVSKRTVNAGSTAVTTTFGYLAGAHGTNSTTPLVRTLTQAGTTLTYAYNETGNITSINDGSKTISYEYDLLGQLIRANDPYDPTGGTSGTTWVFEYDLGGNIQKKIAYAYTTGAVGSAVQTNTFTYGASAWKDKLTMFNGVGISYDEIGNPLSDGTWSYTWAKGRQLQSMSKSGEAVSFVYNTDGLRVQKTATSTGTTKYSMHGRNLVHLTNGSNNLHFFYDAQNKPAVVVFNGTTYAYLYNQQDDVIGLVDSNGTKMVSYSYDAWGKPISKTGTLANTLGKLNPFRYRGYIFDEETGLYYLHSRYYNPNLCRFINADDVESLGADGDINGYQLFIYCMNDPVNNKDEAGSWSLPNWAKVAIGAALIVGAAVVATVATGGVACFAAGAAIGAAKGAVSGAIGGAITGAIQSRIETGSWDGALEAAVDGAADGFLGGAIGGFITGGITSKHCFVAGTLIHTEDGLVPIEEIKPDQLVWAEDPETGERALKRVVCLFRNEKYELVHVQVNGETITCTTEHPFYVPGKGWVVAKDLQANDRLELLNGGEAYIDSVNLESLDEPVKVYNFEVEEFHTYFVGASSYLVHNVCMGSRNQKVAAAAKKGRETHKNWNFGKGVKKEYTIRGMVNGKEVVRRIDGIDKVNRIIYELKPNNPRAIARGWKQLDQYANMLGGEWTQVLVLY